MPPPETPRVSADSAPGVSRLLPATPAMIYPAVKMIAHSCRSRRYGSVDIKFAR